MTLSECFPVEVEAICTHFPRVCAVSFFQGEVPQSIPKFPGPTGFWIHFSTQLATGIPKQHLNSPCRFVASEVTLW